MLPKSEEQKEQMVVSEWVVHTHFTLICGGLESLPHLTRISGQTLQKQSIHANSVLCLSQQRILVLDKEMSEGI